MHVSAVCSCCAHRKHGTFHVLSSSFFYSMLIMFQLGGHYIAYTALPHSPPISSVPESQPNTSDTQEASTPPAPISRTATFEKTAETKTKHGHGHHHHLHHERKWCYISDTTVKLTTLSEVLKAKAYICMYERI